MWLKRIIKSEITFRFFILGFVCLIAYITIAPYHNEVLQPIKINEWNQDGTLNRTLDGEILVSNGLGSLGNKTNSYAVSLKNTNYRYYVVVSRNPDILSNGTWGGEVSWENPFSAFSDKYYTIAK